ncbi:MAG: flagellar motor protein MotA, partial [Pseudomonadota bacterium]
FRETVDTRRARFPREPNLISAITPILVDADKRGGRLSPATTRTMLDSIGTKMDEGREMGRYLGNLLVFLGLLGTFWGLLETVNAVAQTISSLADTSGPAEDAVTQLIANLKEPLGGMGTAFSSSLFGLGGSLVVGFLDLQAGQAQNRFYSNLEEWLVGLTDNSAPANGASSSYADAGDQGAILEALAKVENALAQTAQAQIEANSAQSADLRDEIRALNRTLIRVGGGE